MAPATKKPATDLRIPAEVRVGIIGRWTPEQEKQVAAAFREIRSELEELLDHSRATFTLVPGPNHDAERWWAARNSKVSIMQRLLHCLPAESRRYFRSFRTVPARTRFFKIVLAANQNLPGTAAAERGPAEQSIRNCDVLIAIWTPPSGLTPAGVAPLIRFALEDAGRTLYWIDPASGRMKRYDNYDRFIDSFVHLNRYNGERASPARIAVEVNAEIEKLERLASKAGLEAAALDPLRERVIPHFVRAGRLASGWQRRYIAAGFAIYLLAAVAVGTGTGAILGHPRMAFIEVAEMALILIIISSSELLELLRRWLDYRFLTERLRAAIHLYVAGMSSKIGDEESTQWMNRALGWICDREPSQFPAGNLEAVKYFTRKGWVEDQRNYYFNRGGQLESWQKWSLRLGSFLFLTAAATALVHALEVSGAPEAWAGAAIIIPAFAASVAGFRAFREYRRTALQYSAMVRKLNDIAKRIKEAATSGELKELLAQADGAISQEHSGWRVLVHVHEPIEEI